MFPFEKFTTVIFLGTEFTIGGDNSAEGSLGPSPKPGQTGPSPMGSNSSFNGSGMQALPPSGMPPMVLPGRLPLPLDRPMPPPFMM